MPRKCRVLPAHHITRTAPLRFAGPQFPFSPSSSSFSSFNLSYFTDSSQPRSVPSHPRTKMSAVPNLPEDVLFYSHKGLYNTRCDAMVNPPPYKVAEEEEECSLHIEHAIAAAEALKKEEEKGKGETCVTNSDAPATTNGKFKAPPTVPWAIHDTPVENHRPLKVIVIGAGYSGIYCGIRIPERLRNCELVIYEKNAGVGGE